MRRKIIILTIGYFALGILTFTAGSCEALWTYDTTICDIRFAGLNSIDKTDNSIPDTFDGQIGFEIMSEHLSTHCFIPNIQVFNTAYAMTPCANFHNHLMKSTYQLFLDKEIIVNSDTITPNTNLFYIPEIRGLTDINVDEGCKFVTSTIIFRQELIDRIQFEPGEYLVTFICATNDNKEFTKTRTVIFKE